MLTQFDGSVMFCCGFTIMCIYRQTPESPVIQYTEFAFQSGPHGLKHITVSKIDCGSTPTDVTGNRSACWGHEIFGI